MSDDRDTQPVCSECGDPWCEGCVCPDCGYEQCICNRPWPPFTD